MALRTLSWKNKTRAAILEWQLRMQAAAHVDRELPTAVLLSHWAGVVSCA
jgi:hypothetical protein